MPEKPSVTDAEFEIVDHSLRLSAGDVVYALWIGGFAFLAWATNSPVASALLVTLAGFAGPMRRWLGSLNESVSWRQAEWLRHRMDPRQPWRRRALRRP